MANLPRRIIKETQRLLQVKYFVKVPKQNLILITAKLEDLKHISGTGAWHCGSP